MAAPPNSTSSFPQTFKNAAEQSLIPSFLIGGKGTLQLYGRVASSQGNRNSQLVVRAHRHEQPWATAADPPVLVWETESMWAKWGRWTAKSLCKGTWVVPALAELMAWETWRLPVQCLRMQLCQNMMQTELGWAVWGTGLYSKLPAYNVQLIAQLQCNSLVFTNRGRWLCTLRTQNVQSVLYGLALYIATLGIKVVGSGGKQSTDT